MLPGDEGTLEWKVETVRKSTLAVAVSLSTLLSASISSGWDADARNGVRDMPIVRQQSFRYAPSPWISLPEVPNYDSTEVFITNLKDRVGGLELHRRRELHRSA